MPPMNFWTDGDCIDRDRIDLVHGMVDYSLSFWQKNVKDSIFEWWIAQNSFLFLTIF